MHVDSCLSVYNADVANGAQDAIERGWFRKNLSLAGEPDMLAIISTAQEVISALAYMHERDLIHGDVRGANIMLCSSTADQRGFTAQVRQPLLC